MTPTLSSTCTSEPLNLPALRTAFVLQSVQKTCDSNRVTEKGCERYFPP